MLCTSVKVRKEGKPEKLAQTGEDEEMRQVKRSWCPGLGPSAEKGHRSGSLNEARRVNSPISCWFLSLDNCARARCCHWGQLEEGPEGTLVTALTRGVVRR